MFLNKIKRHSFILWMLGVSFLLLYLFLRLHHPLGTDEAKYALDIAYPHPPIGRWFMQVSQWIFGFNAYAVTYPLSLIGAICVMLSYVLCRRLQISQNQSTLLAISFGLYPAVMRFAQSGYLSLFLTTGLLITAIGFIKIFTSSDAQREHGYAILTFGLLFSTWSQLQSILLIAASVITYLVYLKKMNWRPALSWLEKYCLILIFLHAIALILYIATNPLIIGDILGYSKMGTKAINVFFWGRFSLAVTAPLIGVLVLPCIALYKTFKSNDAFWLLALWNCILSSLLILLMLNYPAEYYIPYLSIPILISTIFIIKEKIFGAQTLAVLILLYIILFITAFPLLSSHETGEIEVLRPAIAKIISSEKEVIVLGGYGFEMDYFFPAGLHKLPTDRIIRENINLVFVPRDKPLNQQEESWLHTLFFSSTLGSFDIYEQLSCTEQ